MEQVFVKILGSRGSVPIEGSKFAVHGGMTSCVYVNIGGQSIFFDAGSGLLNMDCTQLVTAENGKVSILMSHTHVDHLIGLPSSPLMQRRDINLDIYGTKRDGLCIKEQIDRLMCPPLWPVLTKTFSDHVYFHDTKKEFYIGEVKVTTAEGTHPGGCTLYRLDYKDKSVVYATDNELTEGTMGAFADFARGCDLLFIDGQYSVDEAPHKVGYGHTDWKTATRAALSSGCEKFYIFHHDPSRDDEALIELQEKLLQITPKGFVAKKRVELWI